MKLLVLVSFLLAVALVRGVELRQKWGLSARYVRASQSAPAMLAPRLESVAFGEVAGSKRNYGPSARYVKGGSSTHDAAVSSSSTAISMLAPRLDLAFSTGADATFVKRNYGLSAGYVRGGTAQQQTSSQQASVSTSSTAASMVAPRLDLAFSTGADSKKRSYGLSSRYVRGGAALGLVSKQSAPSQPSSSSPSPAASTPVSIKRSYAPAARYVKSSSLSSTAAVAVPSSSAPLPSTPSTPPRLSFKSIAARLAVGVFNALTSLLADFKRFWASVFRLGGSRLSAATA